MKVIDAIAKLAGLAGPQLVALLQALAQRAPDLAPEIQEWLDKFDAAVVPDVLAELAALPQGTDPHDHPGDAI